MHVAVVGSGYVGLVAGACFAETGNDVVCVDKDAEKIARLQRNEIPIYEPGLEPMVQRNQAEGRLTFTTDLGAAVRGDLQVLYGDYSRGAPTAVFLKTGEVADIRLGISDLEFDSTIDAKAFEVDPSGAAPMTLEELRRAGPLGERAGG